MQLEIISKRAVRLLICGAAMLTVMTDSSFASPNPESELSTVCPPERVSESRVIEGQNSPAIQLNRQTKYRYSPSIPTSADIYPSACLCGRAFATRIANGVRESNQFSPQTKYVIQLDVDRQATDAINWQASEKFIAEFRSELQDLFPRGTFVTAADSLREDERGAAGSEVKSLAVSFSHTASAQATMAKESSVNDAGPSGSIQMAWALDGAIPAKITIDYAAKTWVATDRNWSHNHPKSFGFYENNYFKTNIIGFSNQLAQSSQEASRIAMENAVHFDSLHYGARYSPEDLEFEVVDQFQQKLSTPSGEFWQAAVLVSVSRKQNASRISAVPAPSNSAELLLMLVAGTFGVTWISSLLFKKVF